MEDTLLHVQFRKSNDYCKNNMYNKPKKIIENSNSNRRVMYLYSTFVLVIVVITPCPTRFVENKEIFFLLFVFRF